MRMHALGRDCSLFSSSGREPVFVITTPIEGCSQGDGKVFMFARCFHFAINALIWCLAGYYLRAIGLLHHLSERIRDLQSVRHALVWACTEFPPRVVTCTRMLPLTLVWPKPDMPCCRSTPSAKRTIASYFRTGQHFRRCEHGRSMQLLEARPRATRARWLPAFRPYTAFPQPSLPRVWALWCYITSCGAGRPRPTPRRWPCIACWIAGVLEPPTLL